MRVSWDILFALVPLAVYGLFTWGIIWLLRRLNILPHTRILVGFLVLSIIAGLLAVWAWPADIGVLLNLPAILLGDKVYVWSIRFWGDPSSPQAHFTIPWLLRVPQVYALVSVVFWGLIGVIVQAIFGIKRK